MQLFPSFPEFSTLSRDAGVVPVWREFLFDTDTAVTAYEKLYRPPFGFLLESVVGGEQWARYSFLGSQPREAWRLKDGKVSVWKPETGWREVDTHDPLEDLDQRLQGSETGPGRRDSPVSGEGRSGSSDTMWSGTSSGFRTPLPTIWIYRTASFSSPTWFWSSTTSWGGEWLWRPFPWSRISPRLSFGTGTRRGGIGPGS